MGKFVAENTVKKLIRVGKAVKGAKVLVLGLTFKENVGDIRNTKVVDIISELNEYMVETMIYDPFASAGEVRHEYGLEIERQEVANAWPPQDCVRPGEPSLEAVPPVDAVARARCILRRPGISHIL